MIHPLPTAGRKRPSPARAALPPYLKIGARPDLISFPGQLETAAGETASKVAERELTVRAPRPFRSVLVPLDGTPFAEHALPLALAIALRSGASVRVLHVHAGLDSFYEPIEFQRNSGLNSWRKERQRWYLRGVLQRIAKVSPATVLPALREAPKNAAAVIAAEAETAATWFLARPWRRADFFTSSERKATRSGRHTECACYLGERPTAAGVRFRPSGSRW